MKIIDYSYLRTTCCQSNSKPVGNSLSIDTTSETHSLDTFLEVSSKVDIVFPNSSGGNDLSMMPIS